MSDPAGDASDPDPGAEPASEGGAGEPAAGELDPGLFGKLPRSRPGARSPRRQQAGARSAPRRRERTPGTRPAAVAATESAEPAPPRAEREPPAREGTDEQSGGIEELAWAGIAVTAEAATLGVRLLSRAIDAARRATERR